MADTDVKEKAEETTDGGGKKQLLIGLFIGVAVVAAYFMLIAKPAAPPEEGAAPPEPAMVEPVDGAVLEVATLTVNLDSEEMRYARVQFGLVMAAETVLDPAPWFPLMQDKAISTIASFTPEELRTTAGHDRLRTALTEDALEIWTEGDVLRVVLYDLIVQ